MLLHGGMRPREKQEAMAAFASGAADVLVATTVIEVGIDVPNATVMLVENAERFGHLPAAPAARPGRARRACGDAAFSSARRTAARRLGCAPWPSTPTASAWPRSTWRLRREGELVGTRQSGLGQFQVACLPEDAQLLERARAQAEAIVAGDPELR